MIYVGKYEVENGTIHSEINFKKYADIPGMISVVGLDDFNLKVTGKREQNNIVLIGYVVENPSRTIEIHAIRRADLP